MIVLGLLPKMAALVESVPTFVLGGAGLVEAECGGAALEAAMLRWRCCSS
jgi:hypothetical protein